MIDIVLKDRDIPQAVAFLSQRLLALVEGRYELEDLVISKTLRSYYKFPQQIAHAVLARRMRERDPGSAPQVRTNLNLAGITRDGVEGRSPRFDQTLKFCAGPRHKAA